MALEGLTFLAVAAAGIIYYGQLRAMLAANQINRDALESVQRAFVRLDNIQTDFLHAPDGKETYIQFTAQWTNSSSTPAMELIQAFATSELPSEPDGKPFYGDVSVKHSTIVVGPGGHTESSPHVFRESALGTAPDAKNWRERIQIKPNIYAWGWVAYRDVFPDTKPHVTEFCYRLNQILHPTRPTENGKTSWVNCSHHNCVDDYCPDYQTITGMLPPRL
jgi:hypothetical protein